MQYLSENNILLFLTQIFILLTLAKILGGFFHHWGQPALVGELLVGIILGPTILGRFIPELHTAIFPCKLVQSNMLETISWFGVLFLLLATGFEVSLSSVWKQGKEAMTIGVVGVVIPLVIGVAVFWWFPEKYWGTAANRLSFTLFLSAAAAISAIPVIARILHDLDILKTDLGLTILSAFVINDVLGWFVFTMVLGMAVTTEHGEGNGLARTIFEVVMFGTICLTIGSSFVSKVTAWLKKSNLPQPGTTLSFILCLAVLCGAVTQWIGIHAILGFFLAGIMVGNSKEVSEQTRETISQIVHAIFVPIFFATIGLKIDFLSNFDFLTIVVFTVVAIGGKFIGAWVGALAARIPKDDSFSIGIAHIPGGAMEIIIGMLALETNLITENVFVAVVFGAISSSIAVGPLLAWTIKKRSALDAGKFLLRHAIITNLVSQNRQDAIAEVGAKLAEAGGIDSQLVIDAVKRREEIMGTGFEQGLAVPHARIEELTAPIIAFARSKSGIDWNTRDGHPVHYIFMVLTPQHEEGAQVKILAAIARFMNQRQAQDSVANAVEANDIFNILNPKLTFEN